MSLPPTIVKIKRKRTDEPVGYLRVHEAQGKRQRRAGEYVFSRQPTPESGHEFTSPQSTSQSRPIKPLHRTVSSQALGTQYHTSTAQSAFSQTHNAADGRVIAMQVDQTAQAPITSASTDSSSPASTSDQRAKPSEPRRFHISRASNSPLRLAHGIQSSDRKRKEPETVFVERRVRPRSSDQSQLPTPLQPTKAVEPPLNRPLKKPGLNARSPVPRSRDPSPHKASPLVPVAERSTKLPSGLINRYNVSPEDLAAQMHAYTLQEIGYSIANSEVPKPQPQPPPEVIHKRTLTKFKPKKPALRYSERHPEEKIDNSMDIDDEYLEEEIDSDGDYIIDTYIRVPAEALKVSEMENNIGLLVLDTQPDIDEFYKEEEESDEEGDDEDEDENAENHYSADYPDEEVDSDDEYGRNPYNYRTHNASDLEEYDQDDVTFSDDESESTKYPWQKPAWQKRQDTPIDEEY